MRHSARMRSACSGQRSIATVRGASTLLPAGKSSAPGALCLSLRLSLRLLPDQAAASPRPAQAALTEASIQNKALRYEQRKQTMEETKHLRQAYQVARYKQQAAIHSKLRSSSVSAPH